MLYKIRKQGKLKPDLLSEFCRMIGAMTGSGITLARSMEILQDSVEDKRIAGLYGKLQSKIEQGYPISDAMEEMKMFPELLINMFRAAETSGRFEETAKRMAEYYRKEHRMRGQIKTATVYPKFLCLMLLVVVLFVFLVILPMVEPLFREMELPVVTKILISVSSFVKEKWYMLVFFALLFTVFGMVVRANEKFHRLRDKIQLRLPVIGKNMCTIYTARFARSLGSLYGSGVAMVESLEIASRTIGNRYLEEQFSEVVRKVKNGELLSRAVKNVDGFDKKLAPIILVGEETGKLDGMLENIAETYEYEAEAALTRLIALIEPVMIVIIGIVIGSILLGIMLPMWSMYEYIG